MRPDTYPSPQNLNSGHCQPGTSTSPQVSTDGGTALPPAPVPQPVVTWGTPEMYPQDQAPVNTSTQPGDYNVPSPDEDEQTS